MQANKQTYSFYSFISRRTFSNSSELSNNTQFHEWLVGVTDGDGTFCFSKNKDVYWVFAFVIKQSNYNMRLLDYIKSELKVGSINHDEATNTAAYRIGSMKDLKQHILPIFDKNLLLTSKFFSYDLFKQALLIYTDSQLSRKEKNNKISELKTKQLPINYISPAWNKTDYLVSNVKEATKVITKFWLVGFTEAEGSFYLTKQGPKRMRHQFAISQKLDPIVLEGIAFILKMKFTKKKTHNSVTSTTNESKKLVLKYFSKTMKGMKSPEYRIWARSFNKRGQGYGYLLNVQTLMREIRSIRLTKNFKKLK